MRGGLVGFIAETEMENPRDRCKTLDGKGLSVPSKGRVSYGRNLAVPKRAATYRQWPYRCREAMFTPALAMASAARSWRSRDPGLAGRPELWGGATTKRIASGAGMSV